MLHHGPATATVVGQDYSMAAQLQQLELGLYFGGAAAELLLALPPQLLPLSGALPPSAFKSSKNSRSSTTSQASPSSLPGSTSPFEASFHASSMEESLLSSPCSSLLLLLLLSLLELDELGAESEKPLPSEDIAASPCMSTAGEPPAPTSSEPADMLPDAPAAPPASLLPRPRPFADLGHRGHHRLARSSSF